METQSLSNMYSFIESFRGLAKKQERVAIDNDDVFQLHYRYTVCLLVICSGLLTSNQFFGNPMTCYLRGESLPERMVTNYCWVTATYTLKHINQPVVREVEDLSDGQKQFVQRFVSLGGKLTFFRFGYSQQLLAAAQPGLGAFHAESTRRSTTCTTSGSSSSYAFRYTSLTHGSHFGVFDVYMPTSDALPWTLVRRLTSHQKFDAICLLFSP